MHAEHTLLAPRLGSSLPTVPRLSRRVGFAAIAFAFVSVAALSTASSALYGLYERHEHSSPITITIVYAVYAAGVTASLLLAGHVSDWYGRKAVLIPALTLAIAAAVLFISWQSLTGLLVARVITGLALGATVATATAYITDLDAGPDGAVTRRAGTVGRIAQVGGLATGPLASGLLARYAAAGLTLPYVVLPVALLVAMLAVALTREGRPAAHPLPTYRPQRPNVPAHARSQFLAAIAGAALAFATWGLFAGLAGRFLAGPLHHPSPALTGAAIFLTFGTGIVVQTTTTNFRMATGLNSDLTVAGRHTVARHDRYEDAQRAVDHLSDAGFPVQEVEIVGSGLHSWNTSRAGRRPAARRLPGPAAAPGWACS